MAKHFFRCMFVTFALDLLFGLGTVSASNLQPVPNYAHVIDQTHTLSSEQFAVIEQKLLRYEAATGTQIAVIIVQTSKPETIEQFTNRIGNSWKLGRAGIGDGVILLLAIDDHDARIEVARALEPALTDVQAHRILREFASPLFARKDFSGGIGVALDLIFKSLALENLPPGNAAGNQIKIEPLTLISIVGGMVAYAIFFAVLLGSAVGFWGLLSFFGVAAAIIICLIAGIITSGVIGSYYVSSAWMVVGAGLITTGLMGCATYLWGQKFRRFSDKQRTPRRSRLKKGYPVGSGMQDESLWKDSTSLSSSSSSSSKSGGGGDFAGGGASTKW